MGMYSPAPHRTSVSSAPYRTRPLSRRTQMMARGPGWRLAEGAGMTWHVRLTNEASDPVLTWAHMLRTIRCLADGRGLRPLVVDLRRAPRLSGKAAEAAALVFEQYEVSGIRVATIAGPDMVLAVRLHRLHNLNAPTQGLACLGGDEAFEWASQCPPPASVPFGCVDAVRVPQLRA